MRNVIIEKQLLKILKSESKDNLIFTILNMLNGTYDYKSENLKRLSTSEIKLHLEKLVKLVTNYDLNFEESNDFFDIMEHFCNQLEFFDYESLNNVTLESLKYDLQIYSNNLRKNKSMISKSIFSILLASTIFATLMSISKNNEKRIDNKKEDLVIETLEDNKPSAISVSVIPASVKKFEFEYLVDPKTMYYTNAKTSLHGINESLIDEDTVQPTSYLLETLDDNASDEQIINEEILEEEPSEDKTEEIIEEPSENVNEENEEESIEQVPEEVIDNNVPIEEEIDVQHEEYADAELEEKINEILEYYNLTEDQFNVVCAIIMAEAKEGSYEDNYATTATMVARTLAPDYVNYANHFGLDGTSLYGQAITPGQFVVYEHGSHYRFLDVRSGEGFRGIIDCLMDAKDSEKKYDIEYYLQLRAWNTAYIGIRKYYVEGGNMYFEEFVLEYDLENNDELQR